MDNLTPRERMRALRLKESGEVSGDGSASVTNLRSADSDSGCSVTQSPEPCPWCCHCAHSEVEERLAASPRPRKTENM
jgi:hypothetical protein